MTRSGQKLGSKIYDNWSRTYDPRTDLWPTICFRGFFVCFFANFLAKKTFYLAFLQRFLVQCNTFMTGIKLGKLDFIWNSGFGLMLLQSWYDMAAVPLFISSSNAESIHILCSFGWTCHKATKGTLKTRKVG